GLRTAAATGFRRSRPATGNHRAEPLATAPAAGRAAAGLRRAGKGAGRGSVPAPAAGCGRSPLARAAQRGAGVAASASAERRSPGAWPGAGQQRVVVGGGAFAVGLAQRIRGRGRQRRLAARTGGACRYSQSDALTAGRDCRRTRARMVASLASAGATAALALRVRRRRALGVATVASLALLARGVALSVLELRRRELRGEPSGWDAAVHPVLQRIYAARGVLQPAGVEHRLQRLLPPLGLGGLDAATDLLAEAIRDDWSILIAGDYDCDGATGTAVAVRGLRMLGAQRVSYAVPNRFVHGYGLTPALVDSLQPYPQLIVTVDNGVASMAGAARAHELVMRVIVTDHHLPGEQLPRCDAMVNPNLVGDAFPSKALAGVGVMFYLLLALRARLRERGALGTPEPDLSTLLDLVALGTVADLVPLDFNNRVLVDAGLKRIRAGRACAGIAALVECGKRSVATLCASDLGFAV